MFQLLVIFCVDYNGMNKFLGQDSKHSSMTSVIPTSGPVIIKVAKDDEERSIRQLGSFNAEHAFVSMLKVLETHHDKGPILDKQPYFKASPDDSLNVFKLEDLEKSVENLEKKIKLVSRRLAESKREKAEIARRIEYLDNTLIQRSKEEMVATFMKESPTEKDLENLAQLQDKLNTRSKSHKELKQLQKQREMLNKTLKNAENIITDSSVVRKQRHVVIIEPSVIERERSRASRDRLTQLQMDEKEQARSLLGSKDNLLSSTSVDELSTLQITSGNSGNNLDHNLIDNIRIKKKALKQMIKQQDIELENESPDRDPWTGEKLKPPEENPIQKTSSTESFNSTSKQKNHEFVKPMGTSSIEDPENKTVSSPKTPETNTESGQENTFDEPVMNQSREETKNKSDINSQNTVNPQTTESQHFAHEDKGPKEVTKTEIEKSEQTSDEKHEETKPNEKVDVKHSEINSMIEKEPFDEAQPSSAAEEGQKNENPITSQTPQSHANIKNEHKIQDEQEGKDLKTLQDAEVSGNTLDIKDSEVHVKTLDDQKVVEKSKSSENHETLDDQKVVEQSKSSENHETLDDKKVVEKSKSSENHETLDDQKVVEQSTSSENHKTLDDQKVVEQSKSSENHETLDDKKVVEKSKSSENHETLDDQKVVEQSTSSENHKTLDDQKVVEQSKSSENHETLDDQKVVEQSKSSEDPHKKDDQTVKSQEQEQNKAVQTKSDEKV